MSERSDKFIRIVLLLEGGKKYTNDPNDLGAGTKYGISDARDGKVDGLADLNNDGKGDKPIKDLSEDDAICMYKKQYYDPCKCDLINNELLALHVFDFAVNAGISRSIKYLQKTAGVGSDGIFGKQTLEAVNKTDLALPFINVRKEYYKRIAQQSLEEFEAKIKRKATTREKLTKTQYKYLNGWLNRVENLKNHLL